MTISRRRVLVVAGEASGDRIAAMTARALGERGGVVCFGVGGEACRRAGVEVHGDGSSAAVMGLGDAALRLPWIARGALDLVVRARRDPPAAALLVSTTELSARLGRWLRGRGVRVLWCVAPQVWAWRAGRLRTAGRAFDRLAVILPFEEALWRGAGVDARYVGHPALEAPQVPRAEVRERLSLSGDGVAIAVLPGSRAGEIARLGGPLCEAAKLLCGAFVSARARLICAASLDGRSREAVRRLGEAWGIPVVYGDVEHGAAGMLGGFDLVICASGTASLEAALAGVPTVVAYRLDALSAAIGRLLVRTPYIALPNVLLGRRAVAELVQGEATAAGIARAGERAFAGRDGALGVREELLAILRPPSPEPFGERVARMLDDWLPAALEG